MLIKSKIGVSLALIFLSAAMAAPTLADDVRVGTTGGYLPFTAQDAGGNWIGYDIDIVTEACKRAGHACTFVQNPWDSIIPSLVTKRFDVIVSGMSITDARRQKVDFTVAYADTPAWIIGAKNNPAFDSVADFKATTVALKGKTIGVLTGNIYEAFVRKEIPDAQIRFYPTQEQANLDLVSGRIDATIQDAGALGDFLKSADGTNFRQVGPNITASDFPLLGEGLGFALRKEDSKLTEGFNKVLLDMRADGTIRSTSEKWVGYDMTPKSQ